MEEKRANDRRFLQQQLSLLRRPDSRDDSRVIEERESSILPDSIESECFPDSMLREVEQYCRLISKILIDIDLAILLKSQVQRNRMTIHNPRRPNAQRECQTPFTMRMPIDDSYG